MEFISRQVVSPNKGVESAGKFKGQANEADNTVQRVVCTVPMGATATVRVTCVENLGTEPYVNFALVWSVYRSGKFVQCGLHPV